MLSHGALQASATQKEDLPHFRHQAVLQALPNQQSCPAQLRQCNKALSDKLKANADKRRQEEPDPRGHEIVVFDVDLTQVPLPRSHRGKRPGNCAMQAIRSLGHVSYVLEVQQEALPLRQAHQAKMPRQAAALPPGSTPSMAGRPRQSCQPCQAFGDMGRHFAASKG